MYDVAIIGLGPAGSTLARLLDENYSVVAIDRKNRSGPGGFMKPCGGLLATDAQKALSKLNLSLPKDILVDPQIFAVRTIDAGRDLERHYQRFYINLDRHRFDQWLMRLIPARVEVVEGAVCTGVLRTADGFELAYTREGREEKVRARCVIGAEGSGSLVRRTLFKDRPIGRALSIQRHFAGESMKPVYSCVFDPGITDSYCWSLSKDGLFVVGGAFPIRDGMRRFEKLLETLRQRGCRLGEPVRTEACLVSRPRRMRDFCLGGGGAFLIGEAAGLISPSSLEGISYALDSAQILSGVLNARPGDPHRAYRARMLPMRLKLLAKTVKSQFMYRPFLRRLVMASGLQAIKVIGDGRRDEDGASG